MNLFINYAIDSNLNEVCTNKNTKIKREKSIEKYQSWKTFENVKNALQR